MYTQNGDWGEERGEIWRNNGRKPSRFDEKQSVNSRSSTNPKYDNKNPTHRHIIRKLLKAKGKEIVLKLEEKVTHYSRGPIMP